MISQKTSSIEEKIHQATLTPDPGQEFAGVLWERMITLPQRPPSREPRIRNIFKRPVWALTASIVLILAIVVAILGPQRVYAEFMRLFGYVPDVGFVDLDQVRVLENGVTQKHDNRELTVQRGLITTYGTDLWLEFSDEARPIDGAWLEAPDGSRYDLRDWNYSPNEAGSRGVVAYFPPLPAEINQVTLALPEGWRIPLTWVPGRQGGLTPANIITSDSFSTAENSGESSIAHAKDVPVLCSKAMDIQFCIQAANRTDSGMQVLVEADANGKFISGSTFSLSIFDVPGETQNLTLSDANGNVYPVDAKLIEAQGEPTARMSTLSFPGAQDIQGRLTLNVPTVLVSLPISNVITIDLGDKPSPGQTLMVDQTIDVAGYPVHFSQAVLQGNGKDNLSLNLISDLLDDSAQIRPYSLDPGKPDGIQTGYGAGSGPDQLSLSVDLLQPSGLVTGILRIPLVSALLKVRGPFTLTFDAPIEQPISTSTPQIIGDSTFEPSQGGNPLSMNAYQYAGRELHSGDLLAVVLGDGQSTLYAASPDARFAAEKVAVLPGQVLAVYPHSDRKGIDYLTGEYDKDTNVTLYQQLYTLRFGDPNPRLLIGQFEHSATDFAWSYDGRYLAYLINNEQPGGQDYLHPVRLIDLNCRTSGDCNAFTADTGEQYVYQISWSPTDYRIALGGQMEGPENFSSDIFLLDFGTAKLTNLTRSATIQDWAPAHWASKGDALLYVCFTGTLPLNEYSLCRNGLIEGKDEVVVAQLPWNMNRFLFTADRWLVDQAPVMSNGVYSLRAYDLKNGQSSVLLEWPMKEKTSYIDTSVSPDGQWATTNIEDLGGLLVLNIESKKSTVVMPYEAKLFLVTWVK